MKKKQKIIILSLIIVCVIGLSIILYKVFNKPESRQININSDEVEYIEIKYHNKTSEIVNKETITEIIDNLNKLRIEKQEETEKNVYKFQVNGLENIDKTEFINTYNEI